MDVVFFSRIRQIFLDSFDNYKDIVRNIYTSSLFKGSCYIFYNRWKFFVVKISNWTEIFWKVLQWALYSWYVMRSLTKKMREITKKLLAESTRKNIFTCLFSVYNITMKAIGFQSLRLKCSDITQVNVKMWNVQYCQLLLVRY